MNTDTHYSILGVTEEATQEEIKKAYRRLAKENHPDKGGDEETFKKISVAYDIIGDEQKRNEYDYQRKNPFANMGGGFNDMFSQMFNNTFSQKRQTQRSHTTNINIPITVLESFIGGKKTITYKRKTSCEPCNGTGGDKKVCSTCNGNGQIVTKIGNGMFVQMATQICPSCYGKGEFITNPCFVCSGTATKDEIKNIDINIPHGVDGGQFLRLQGMGDYKSGIFGDLIARIQIEKVDNFEKYGNHLIYNLFFDLDDLKKDSFQIPHPEGTITIKFPKKIDTSKPLRVKGKGFKLDTIGDLMINQFLKYDRD